MRNELKSIYQKQWAGLSEQMLQLMDDEPSSMKPTSPLLIAVDEERYFNADIKVMIVGQETNSWHGEFGSKSIDQLFQFYDRFYNQDRVGSGFKGYTGPFWDFYREFATQLEAKEKDKKVAFIWNNIIKIGNHTRNAGTPRKSIRDIEREHFHVFKEEVKILKPDIILFIAGPNYDKYIMRYFADISYSAVSSDYKKRALAKLTSTDLPVKTFRTYHPSYLRRAGLEKNILSLIFRALGYSD